MEQNIKNRLTTGTTTIGIVCKDGIVLAADKRASGGYRIMDKNAEKIRPLQNPPQIIRSRADLRKKIIFVSIKKV